MNVAGLYLLNQLDAPRPLGLRIFRLSNLEWDYIDELAERSPNGISLYSCDLTMKLTDGANDLRYPKFPASHELSKHQTRKEIDKLDHLLDLMNVPNDHKGIIIYGSMSSQVTLCSIIGLRRVNDEYWGHGDLIYEVVNGLRPSWDWNAVSSVSFPIVGGDIRLSQPIQLKGSYAEDILEIYTRDISVLNREGNS